MWLVRVFIPGRGIRIGVHYGDTVYDVSQQVPTDQRVAAIVGWRSTGRFGRAGEHRRSDAEHLSCRDVR